MNLRHLCKMDKILFSLNQIKMNKTTILLALIMGGLATQSCQQKAKEQTVVETPAVESTATITNLTECQVRVGSLTFTHAFNGADTCVAVNGNQLEFYGITGKDFFIDPNERLSNNTLPILLTELDNTKPFTFMAKVTPEFTPEGMYNAADLIVFANDTLWQKLCYEQDERGGHRIVTVRTQGTSDDNNHELLTVPSVYLKLSSDTHTLASYYSLDKKEWHMVRLYKNYYPSKMWLGIASQCPQKGECTSLFEEISLEQTSVSDFRMGN